MKLFSKCKIENKDNQQFSQQDNQQDNQQFSQQDSQQDNQQDNQQDSQQDNQQFSQQDNQQFSQQDNQQFNKNDDCIIPTKTASHIEDFNLTYNLVEKERINKTIPPDLQKLMDCKRRGVSVLKLYKSNYTIEQMKAAKYTDDDILNAHLPVKPLRAGRYTASDLRAAQYTIEQMKAGGYRAQDMRDAQYTASDLRSAKYTTDELRVGGYNAEEMKAAQYTADEMRVGGYTAYGLRKAEYTADEMRVGGYTADEMRYAQYTADEMRVGGYRAQDMRDAQYTASDLRSAKYTTDELRVGGYNAEEMREAGYTASELYVAKYTAFNLREAGYTAFNLREAGYTASELYVAKYTAFNLREAGYTAFNLREAGYTAFNLIEAGYSVGQLRVGGYRAYELRYDGYSIGQLRAGGYLVSELEGCNYMFYELKEAGYTAFDLREAGHNAYKLKVFGYTAEEMNAGGYKIYELREAEYTDDDIFEAGYSIDQLRQSGCFINLLKNEAILSKYEQGEEPQDEVVYGLKKITNERRNELVKFWGEKLLKKWEEKRKSFGSEPMLSSSYGYQKADPKEFRAILNYQMENSKFFSLGNSFYKKANIKWRKEDVSTISDADLSERIKKIDTGFDQFVFSPWNDDKTIRYNQLEDSTKILLKQIILNIEDVKSNPQKYNDVVNVIIPLLENTENACIGRLIGIIGEVSASLDSIEMNENGENISSDNVLEDTIFTTFRQQIMQTASAKYSEKLKNDVHAQASFKNTFSNAWNTDFIDSTKTKNTDLGHNDVFFGSKREGANLLINNFKLENLSEIAKEKFIEYGGLSENLFNTTMKVKVTFDQYCYYNKNHKTKEEIKDLLEKNKNEDEESYVKLDEWLNNKTSIDFEEITSCLMLLTDNKTAKELFPELYYEDEKGSSIKQEKAKYFGNIFFIAYLFNNGTFVDNEYSN